MKVLVLWEEIPETCKLLMIDMTHEEFMELKAAHSHYIGNYSTTDYADEISQALCRCTRVSKKASRVGGRANKVLVALVNIGEGWRN